MDEIMSVQNFVNRMNNYVDTYNQTAEKGEELLHWTIKDGYPVFATD